MNYYKSKLNLIKVALGMDVKMAEAVLEDGVTKVEAEAFEPGMKIFVVSESGEKAPAPEGVHVAEDGTKITVDAEGTITLVEAPEPVEEGVEIEIEAAEEEIKEEVKVEEEPKTELEEIVDEKIEEAMGKVYMALEEVVKEISDVKEEMSAFKAKMEKMSKTPASKKLSTFNSEADVDSLESRIDHLKELKKTFGQKRNF